MPALARAVLDALPATIWAVDLDGCITFAGGARARWADEQSIAGRPVWDAMVDVASRAQFQHAMETLRAGRAHVVSWESAWSSPEEERIFLVQVSPVHEDHAVSGFVVTSVDVTAMVHSRQVLVDSGMALARTIAVDRALQELAHQLRHAMDCDGVAVALLDERTSALDLVHHSGFDVEDTEIDRHCRPAWLEALANATVVSHTSDRGLEITSPIPGAEGQVGAITVTTGRLHTPHHVAAARRALATMAAQTGAAVDRGRNIRRLEHKRRRDALGDAAAGVAHELRNPLFGISSAAQLLRYRVTEDPVVEKNVGRILREVERLNGMATSLLEYGRPPAIRLVAGDPDAVWDEVLENHRGRLQSRALVLTRQRATLERPVRLDPAQLAQAFSTLLVNAAEAAPEGTDLSLSSTALPNGAWSCDLRNGGPPIPAEVLPHVFELFFSTRPGSAGVGLALCQRVIEEHGGTLTLESSPESGTVARITLPGS